MVACSAMMRRRTSTVLFTWSGSASVAQTSYCNFSMLENQYVSQALGLYLWNLQRQSALEFVVTSFEGEVSNVRETKYKINTTIGEMHSSRRQSNQMNAVPLTVNCSAYSYFPMPFPLLSNGWVLRYGVKSEMIGSRLPHAFNQLYGHKSKQSIAFVD